MQKTRNEFEVDFKRNKHNELLPSIKDLFSRVVRISGGREEWLLS